MCDIEEFLSPPTAFGESEEKTWDAIASCDVWKQVHHYCKINFRKCEQWVQVLIPELIYESMPGEAVYDHIDIMLVDADLDEEEKKQEFQKWIGETLAFGVMGFSGCKKTDRGNTVEFIDLNGTLCENGTIKIYKNSSPLRNSSQGKPVGSVSTVITFIPQKINEEDEDEQPPSKKPKD